MDRITLRKLTRRVALTLIITLELAHYYLQLLDRWGPPRKSNPKLRTVAKLNELGFITISCYRITEHAVDVKLGRLLVQGLGIEALLWAVAVWSAVCVGYDVWVTPDSLASLMQLMAVDVLMWTEMLSSAVGLVERKEGDVLSVMDEKERLNEKEEV
ncbi:hypothetical protein BU25DRAFT_411673 [Macroventuria anomochaeta]|uniref:Uncharacterized protein n=1 Tax=Macroventuria anomochaeta TaxID=301207 RepID=A0ACB6RZY6_9PLEO|nr:uncharacterized protein BU25DRAFT_411673 [Macroventuria anomochaeta]KAF2626708.1 hypothetical protein BU25DRAFT_411673 [Macroventuria anomochaeta]